MNHAKSLVGLIAVALVSLFAPTTASADLSPEQAQKIYAETSPSLVAVKFTWQTEVRGHELIGPGIVVGEDGLVMSNLAVFNLNFPDEQLQDFKIVIPHEDKDPDEIDATFYGRDERTGLAFLKTVEPQKWKAIKFEDVPVGVGDDIFSVGMLPQAANYKPYFMEGNVATLLRGDTPQVLVQGGLAAIGSPVFNAEGKAVGLVNPQQGQTAYLNDPGNVLTAIHNPPKFFVPTSDFLQSLSDYPTPEKPVVMPWIGVLQLTGLTKEVSEHFNLTNQPAIQIGDVIAGGPAEKAGLKKGNIIVKVNGEPLERGDEPIELPGIFRRKIGRMKAGEMVTLSVLTARGEPLKDVQLTLDPMPKRPNTAKRWFAEDLGFSVREAVFFDTYVRRLPADAKGVVVSLVAEQGAAENAGLQMNDMVTDLNGQPVENLEGFRKAYEEARQAEPNEAVVMVVLRESNTQTIRIEPPQ